MKCKRIYYILLSFLILTILLTVISIKERQQNYFIKTIDIEKGIDIGHKTTIKYLYINGYIEDTLYINTILYNDIENYFINNMDFK